MHTWSKNLCSALLLAALTISPYNAALAQPGAAQPLTPTVNVAAPPPPTSTAQFRGVLQVTQFDVSLPLRDMAPLAVAPHTAIERPDRPSGFEGPFGPQSVDPLVQRTTGPQAIPTPSLSFDGPSNLASVSPPDPVGDVGPNHYVAMSNLYFAIYNKTGGLLYGPVANNTLWNGFGGPCQNENAGDPIVLHDQFADRWILTQFTGNGPTYYNCIAISMSPDPTGSYYRYAISSGTNFPDYPKYGVWADAYLLSTREFSGNNFAGIGVYALNRAQMLVGNPAPQIISFLLSPAAGTANLGDGLLPADIDGPTLPPPGSPGYLLGSMDDGGPYAAPQDALTLWKLTVDWVTPANSSLALANTLQVAPFDSIFPCTPNARDCIPQPGTTNKLDILSYRQRLLYRLAYRNFGTYETLVTNQSVEATSNMAGIRWYEIRSPNSNPFIYQQGTYAPGTSDGVHRWMGSLAMDRLGNMALGYSASDATSTFPSVRYTGRLFNDALGLLPQGEAAIINGTGSQTGAQRWGDYTSMNVDPVDDCTFWYVNEYVPVTSSTGWRLRIGAFRFPNCEGAPDFSLAVLPSAQTICVGQPAVYTAHVASLGSFSSAVTLDATGSPGPATFSTNPITPPANSFVTTTFTITNAPVGYHTFYLTGTSTLTQHVASPYLEVLPPLTIAPTLTAPSQGAANVSLPLLLAWEAVAGATTYELQVATDIGFTNVVYSTTGASTSHLVPTNALNANTTYYWRVRATNVCGTGAFAAARHFTTRPLFCAAPAQPILDNTLVTVTLDIPTNGLLTDLNVVLSGTHSFVGDLTFTLTHASLNSTLIDRPGHPVAVSGCGGDNFMVELDDEGPSGPVENQCNNAPALYSQPTPNTALNVFDGSTAEGVWSLRIQDSASGDVGVLQQWCLAPTLVWRTYLPIARR